MDIAPHCSQKLHIVLEPSGPAEHATRSLGIWEQCELRKSGENERTMLLSNHCDNQATFVFAYPWCEKLLTGCMRPTILGDSEGSRV
ncbi:hypothetical protein PAXRUDRAFT_823621, partial [Paxillus rubicundulus Ve08.2h10]